MKNEINVINNELVPKHIILSEIEKKEVMEKFRIKNLNQFPQILKSDPVVKAIKGNPGDLIKIIRQDSTKGSIYYRLIVEE